MLSEIDTDMMLKFVKRNYPVSRIKDNGRFKRAILLDDGHVYHLGNKNQHNLLITKLVDILMKIFYCDDITSFNVVKNFLNIK